MVMGHRVALRVESPCSVTRPSLRGGPPRYGTDTRSVLQVRASSDSHRPRGPTRLHRRDGELRAEHNRPFEIPLDPKANANALTSAADADKARTSTNIDIGKGSSLVHGVGLAGAFSKLPRGIVNTCGSRFVRRPRRPGYRATVPG